MWTGYWLLTAADSIGIQNYMTEDFLSTMDGDNMNLLFNTWWQVKINVLMELQRFGSMDLVYADGFFARNIGYVTTLLKVCCSWNKHNWQ